MHFERDSVTVIGTHWSCTKSHCHALSPVCLSAVPTKPQPLCWQTHSTRHCHKVSASSPHGQFPRHPRSPATCARFPPANRHAWHRQNDLKMKFVTAFSCRLADLPPSRATSLLRLCNQNCTDSALHAHSSCSPPLCDLDRAFSSGHAANINVQSVEKVVVDVHLTLGAHC